jgi:S1-C subfamily serine protease
MNKRIWSLLFVAAIFFFLAPQYLAQDTNLRVQKQQERAILSLDLEFTKKNGNPLEGVLSVVFGADPNGYATGFLVGDGLVMTSYHVVSGQISETKKINLGFKPDDELDVKVYVKGCRATVIKVDQDADLALLEICGSHKTKTPTFQAAPNKDEKLVLIARPHGYKMVSQGIAYGPYTFRGQEYLSAKIDSHDGYSGSPVFNQKAEIVGVFSGYDRIRDVALITPGSKAQKLLEDYVAASKP